MVMYGVDPGDIKECLKCGTTVWPWWLRCEGCGDPHPFRPPPAPTWRCGNCYEEYKSQTDAEECCVPKEEPLAQALWKDLKAGPRRHSLMSAEAAESVPPIYSTENTPLEQKEVPVKLFSIVSNWRWYVIEMDREEGLSFGWVEGHEKELGYFHLDELANITFAGGVPAVERDLYWRPKKLGEIMGQEEVAKWS